MVRERIERACARSGRDPATVRLLAVTKIFGPEVIRESWAAGLREFGENYVQEMERKAAAVADLKGARFHLIGHLQSNKTKKSGAIVFRDRLARFGETGDATGCRGYSARRDDRGQAFRGRTRRRGLMPSALDEIVAPRSDREISNLRGLMTVPPWSEDAGTFAALLCEAS